MKQKTILILVMLLFATIVSSAQCYDRFRSEGISLFNKGDYTKATEFFTKAKDCPDFPLNNDISGWLSKITSKEQEQKEVEEQKQRQKQEQKKRAEQKQRQKQKLKNTYTNYRKKGIINYDIANYQSALDYFEKAKNCGYKSSSNDIETWIEKTKTYLREDYLREDFSNNTNDWWIVDDEKHSYSLSDGKYYFDNKSPYSTYAVWKTISVKENEDFVIETKFKFVSADNDASAGVFWGSYNWNNYYCFSIGKNERYKIYKEQDSTEFVLVPENPSQYINTEDYNKFAIKKVGDEVKFYINDSCVNKIKHQPFLGGNISFFVKYKAQIEIDYLYVYKPDHKEAQRINNDKKAMSTIFYDDFSDDKNDWSYHNKKQKLKIYPFGGELKCYNKNRKSGFMRKKEIKLDYSKNYSIKAKISCYSKDRSDNSELYVNFKDWDNYLYFSISKNGYYDIYIEDQGTGTFYANTLFSKYIHTLFFENELEVKRIGNKIGFYVNGNLIHEIDALVINFSGEKIGIGIPSKSTVEVDYLKVDGYLK